MSTEQHPPMARGSRWLTRTVVVSAAVALLAALPGIAGARHDAGVDASDQDQTGIEGFRLQLTFVEYFNARRFEDIGTLYEEDAILMPPNHEPVRGRAAIVDYWRGIRDVAGEVECHEPLRLSRSGNLISLAGFCTSHSGQVGYNAHELSARQADGSVRYRVDMFGMR
jgi:ketosteroid isomerase-like protein